MTIQLLQVRGSQVAVLGQVARPGRFPLETANVRASEMLAAAGGVTPLGDDVLVVTGVLDTRETIAAALGITVATVRTHIRHILGAVLAPFNAWLVLRGLRSLY